MNTIQSITLKKILLFSLILSTISILQFGCNSSTAQVSNVQVSNVVEKTSELEDSQPTPVPTVFNRDLYEKEFFSGSSQLKTLSFDRYVINNTDAGLSISEYGKELVFVKNPGDAWPGEIGLIDLLSDGKKQLIYEACTCGNHCCSHAWIFDFSNDKPELIYRSSDYDVSDLRTADIDNDGKLELIQSFFANFGFVFDEGCAMVAQPVVSVNFKYDEKAKKYLPLKQLTFWQEKWVEELVRSVSSMNNDFRSGKEISIGCRYDSEILMIALWHIFSGKESEGMAFFDREYLASGKNDLKNKLKQQLSESPLYKRIYNR